MAIGEKVYHSTSPPNIIIPAKIQVFSQHSVSNNVMCTFFPTVKNQDLYTRRTKDKVVVLYILIFTALECKINCNNQNKIKFNFSNPTILPKGNWAIFMLVAAGQEGRAKWFDEENLKRQE
jgi:hypothetical protein